MSAMRLLPAGSRRILVELASLEEAQALFASLVADPVPEVDEIVPAARTLLLRFRTGEAPDRAAFAANLRARDLSGETAATTREVEIPILYDGEDLGEVSRLTGLPVEEVIERHAARDYAVAFTGFAPGFAYLSGGDPALKVPRRQSPRTRIPPESLAIGGEFSGIYPQASPGGWQILGRSAVKMFDPNREPAILLEPGMRVRFRRLESEAAFEREAAANAATPVERPQARPDGTRLEILAAPLPALYQDGGRHGLVGQGISVSGALDRASLAEANRLVGNDAGAAALEIVGGGFAFEAKGQAVLALAGAPSGVAIRAAAGHRIEEACGRAFAVEAGDRVTLSAPASGARIYLAARGGFHVEPVFGSASTDTLAMIGPPPVSTGSTLVVRARKGGPAVAEPSPSSPALPSADETVTLDLVLGPRTDWFTQEGVTSLLTQEWAVTPRSNRIGLRLNAPVPLARADPKAELPSEGTVRGSVQVPHEGQPVLFLADHPLTGGYPVIGVVADHHLDLAGQIPIGARIRFRAVAPFAEIAPRSQGPRP